MIAKGNSYVGLLTEGKDYDIIGDNGEYYTVINDKGKSSRFLKALFMEKPIKEKVKKSKKKIEVDESFVETKEEVNVYKEPVLDTLHETFTIIENLNEILEESEEGFKKLVEKSEEDVIEDKED